MSRLLDGRAQPEFNKSNLQLLRELSAPFRMERVSFSASRSFSRSGKWESCVRYTPLARRNLAIRMNLFAAARAGSCRVVLPTRQANARSSLYFPVLTFAVLVPFLE